MKLKYTGIYAPESSWVEHLYHETVIVRNGVAETDNKTTIETLKTMGFVPLEEWEKDQVKQAEEAREAEEARRAEILKEREEEAKNAEETRKEAEKRTAAQEKKLAKEAAKSDGEKPLVAPNEQESSVSFADAESDGGKGKE